MNIHTLFSFSLLLFLFSLASFILSTADQTCCNSPCRGNEPFIHFPFRLQNHQPKSRGYPGFDLSCDPTNQTILKLPNSGTFTVQAIDYVKQEIWINDPGNCLPLRLLSLNLTASPFSGDSYEPFKLLNCTFHSTMYGINPIGCLSGSNFTVFAVSPTFLASSTACSLVADFMVPVGWRFYERRRSSDLSDDLQLSWGEPWCGRCESREGQCGFKPNSAEIECRGARHGAKRSKQYAITAAVGVPVLLLAFWMLCYIYGHVKARHQRHNPMAELSVTTPQPVIHPGLDRPIIDSYPKTILGESCRLPNPDDTVCSICLSGYRPKEALRSIPECQHYFHADCIDEWFGVNRTCPVCRNSPSLHGGARSVEF